MGYRITIIIIFMIFSATIAQAENPCNIKYGITGYMKPYEWVNAEGKPEGLTIELLDMLSKEAGCSYEVEWHESDKLLDLLVNNKIDMMWYSRLLEYSAPETEFMSPVVKLTVSYRRFLSRKDSPLIDKMEDIRGKTILVMRGMISEMFAESIKGIYGLNIIKYASVEEAISNLSQGYGDFSFFSTNVLSGVMQDGKYKNLRVSGEPIMPAMFELVVNKNNKDLEEKLSNALRALRISGEYDKLLKKWLKTEADYSYIYKISSIVFGSGALLFLMVILWNRSLRIQVMKNTESLKKNSAENMKLREEAMIASRLAALGEMATSVAHEINNPTGLIMHNFNFFTNYAKEVTAVASKHLKGNDMICSMPWKNATEEAAISEKVITNGLKRISGTVNELKEYGGKENRGRTKIDLNECLESAARLTQYFTKKYTENFVIEKLPSEIYIYGNSMQIEETIVNLIQNSCYALTSKLGFIRCGGVEGKDGYVEIYVEDNGRGMSAEVKEKACEAFFTTRKEKGGTGLGLSITSRIMSEHNGYIKIKSEEGRGATVSLFFPIYKEE